MEFKKWLEDIGSVPTGPEPSTAGGAGQAGLISGGGHGSGAFDNWGVELRTPSRRKKKLPPLGNLGSIPRKDPRPPRDNLELSHL